MDGEREGQRIDNFLLYTLKKAPKSLIYRILRTGQVRVNGKRIKPDYKLVAGDLVRIPPVQLAPDHEPALASANQLQSLSKQLVFEDRLFLVLNKPSGLASHGGSGIELGAIERLRQLRPQDNLELVHRLDRDTSGILLLARKHSALRAVQEKIRLGQVRKRYLALLVGRMPKPLINVDAPLRKSILRGGERMVAVDASGKPSRSQFRLIEQYPGYAYVEVLIDTGRTHQIRVHSQHLGLPVAGDDKYGDSQANKALRGLGLRRLFLHAAELQFTLESGPYAFSAPLPEDLQAFLSRL